MTSESESPQEWKTARWHPTIPIFRPSYWLRHLVPDGLVGVTLGWVRYVSEESLSITVYIAIPIFYLQLTFSAKF